MIVSFNDQERRALAEIGRLVGTIWTDTMFGMTEDEFEIIKAKLQAMHLTLRPSEPPTKCPTMLSQ